MERKQRSEEGGEERKKRRRDKRKERKGVGVEKESREGALACFLWVVENCQDLTTAQHLEGPAGAPPRTQTRRHPVLAAAALESDLPTAQHRLHATRWLLAAELTFGQTPKRGTQTQQPWAAQASPAHSEMEHATIAEESQACALGETGQPAPSQQVRPSRHTTWQTKA